MRANSTDETCPAPASGRDGACDSRFDGVYDASAPDATPGGFMMLSANGNAAGSGILWAAMQLEPSANPAIRPGIIRAYDASDPSHELWNSEMSGGRDRLGNFAKFAPPLVADGRVYVPTFSNRLQVYGLLAGP